MDVALYLGTIVNINTEINRLNESDKDKTIDKYKKIAEKGAITCPFCNEKMLLRAGKVRDIHFAHLKGKTCLESEAYDSYQYQTKRESKKHSVIKEIIYNELKSQEIIKPDLKVEYGYKEKAKEKWKHYPDIYMCKNGREFAISVITNVHEIGDDKVVKTINARNHYFNGKGLQSIWFIEERELADDFDHRVLHLWEAEYGLAVKTEEDLIWDKFVSDIIKQFPEYSIYELFGYKAYARMVTDVRSLYYVHSIGDDILFSVYRVILDESKSPFRAFAVNQGYQLNMSKALVIRDNILLADSEREEVARIDFINQLADRLEKRKADTEAYRIPRSMRVQTHVSLSTEYRVDDEISIFDASIADLDVIEYITKLKTLSITANEAKKLFDYMKRYKGDLEDYGLSFMDVKKTINYSLGRIGDPGIRKWLVEIEYL